MGVLRRVRENVVKSGHVVGLGSSLVLNPSRESKPIGYVDNSGRLQSEACRFTHGAGWKRFLRLQCTSRTRAEKVDLPAWIDVHEYVRARFGPGSERHTEKTASLSLDFREKDGPRPLLQVGSNREPSPLLKPHRDRAVSRRLRRASGAPPWPSPRPPASLSMMPRPSSSHGRASAASVG